jgi:hypothetical protein
MDIDEERVRGITFEGVFDEPGEGIDGGAGRLVEQQYY